MMTYDLEQIEKWLRQGEIIANYVSKELCLEIRRLQHLLGERHETHKEAPISGNNIAAESSTSQR